MSDYWGILEYTGVSYTGSTVVDLCIKILHTVLLRISSGSIIMALECYNYNALVYNWCVITLILATSICILSLRNIRTHQSIIYIFPQVFKDKFGQRKQ